MLMQYGFPPTLLDPGQEQSVEISCELFRAQKLVMTGWMDDVRGRFKIRYSRLPFLDRESVIAYSNVTKNKTRRRTTVEYRDTAANSFVRSYLPSSVVYVPTDPLSYITLDQINIGKIRAMSATTCGVPAAFFGSDVLGNALLLPTAREKMRFMLKNRGDIQVCVYATVFGVSCASAPRGEGVSP